jgi:hypothetical protein
MTEWDTAEKVARLAREAIQRLYNQETDPEFAAKAVAGWITPDDRKARLKALSLSDAWPATTEMVTVSPIGSVPVGGDRQTADKVAGALGDIAAWVAAEAELDGARVARLGAYAWTISWSRS